MEDVISFYEIGDVLKKHLTLIITCLFLGIGLASLVTFFVLPTKYTASAKLLVKLPTSSDTTTVNDVDLNLRMMNTYKELVQIDTVTDEVKRRLASDYNYDGSLGEISVGQTTSSQMLSISCKTDDPIEAETIANVVSEVFQETAMQEYSDQNISIISPAVANSTPVSPNHTTMIALGMIMGLFFGVGIAFLINFFDKTVKEPKFVTDTLDYAILGTVPQMTPKEVSTSLIRNKLSLKTQIEDNSETNKNERELPRVSRRTRGRL